MMAVKGDADAVLLIGEDEYGVERLPDGLDRLVVELFRPGHRHRVALDMDGALRCDCESFRFSKARTGKACKHTRALRRLLALLEKLR